MKRNPREQKWAAGNTVAVSEGDENRVQQRNWNTEEKINGDKAWNENSAKTKQTTPPQTKNLSRLTNIPGGVRLSQLDNKE